MKTFPLISSIAALVAFVFSPLGFETSVSLLFTVGLAGVLLHDYTREAPALRHRLLPIVHRPQATHEVTRAFELAA
jgi:hypothetical protein